MPTAMASCTVINSIYFQEILKLREDIKNEILELIAHHNGQWYWYQIDRYLSYHHPEKPGPYFDEINALKVEGLIEARKNKESTIPRYWLTQSD